MSRSKILIVDDDPYILSVYITMLKHDDYQIIEADDGIKAVALAESEMPDLIIMDWNMPIMDGIEALKTIKHCVKTKDIPVIMITGVMASSENMMTALKEGANEFLRKPFEKIELKARIQAVLFISRSNKILREKYQIIENNSKFTRSLIEGVPHPLVFYTTDGIILGCNRFFGDLVGKTEDDLKNKMVYMQFAGGLDPIHMNTDMELRHGRKAVTYENRTGSNELEYIFSKNLFYNAYGEPEGIICVMTDVTEIKKAHREHTEIRKKELVTSSLHLIHITELNNNLILELSKVNNYVNAEGSKLIHKIISNYKSSASENVWKDFEVRFNNVYEQFYKRLIQKFPDLTSGERKLCALLRLNISTKDIAAITFQNPQSIDVARYRLRKKLNLGTEENLIDFLTDIDH